MILVGDWVGIIILLFVVGIRLFDRIGTDDVPSLVGLDGTTMLRCGANDDIVVGISSSVGSFLLLGKFVAGTMGILSLLLLVGIVNGFNNGSFV
jgi:hypothetical protein